MSDEVNITVGDDAVVDEELEGESEGEGEGGEGEQPSTDEVWQQSLEMQRNGLELLRTAMAANESRDSRLSAENAELRQQVAEIPSRIESAVSAGMDRVVSSIRESLNPPPMETHPSDDSQTVVLESAVPTEAEPSVSISEAPVERRKKHRTL